MAERMRRIGTALGAGAVAGGAVLGGGALLDRVNAVPTVDTSPSVGDASPRIVTTVDGARHLKSPRPSASERAANLALKEVGAGVSVSGIETSVDVANVDVADPNRGFGNTWGNGTEAFLAEPGKVLVGPEFPQDIINDSDGAIDRKHEYNSKMFTSGEPEYFPLPEGGFTVVMFGGGTITYGDRVMEFEHEEGRQYMVILRGPNADNEQDRDLNGTIKISDYIAGHAVAQYYDGNPHGGFISEEHFGQMIQNAHDNLSAGGQNCGDNGCSEVVAAMLDVNTEAFAVVKHVEELEGDEKATLVTAGEVEKVYSNFTTRAPKTN